MSMLASFINLHIPAFLDSESDLSRTRLSLGQISEGIRTLVGRFDCILVSQPICVGNLTG